MHKNAKIKKVVIDGNLQAVILSRCFYTITQQCRNILVKTIKFTQIYCYKLLKNIQLSYANNTVCNDLGCTTDNISQ